MKHYFTVVFISIILSLPANAQDEEGVQITAGVEFRALLGMSIFNVDSVVLIDPGNNFRGVYNFSGGMGFGGVIRVKLTKLLNVESGLYFTRRRYDFRIEDLTTDFRDETSFRMVSYEIPIKGLVYIRMADKIYMNVALGFGTNFIASDVISVEQIYNIKAIKLVWMRGSVLGNIGAEYRTEKDGFFYFGFTFNQMLDDIMVTEANYFREGIPPAFRQRGPLNGSYLSADFRYFFPMAKPKKAVKYVNPDWKNMGK
jgi:hypothetical protein